MCRKAFACVLLIVAPAFAANGQWALATSTLALGESTSHSAIGRGTCSSGQCAFRVEALVKSFASGDPDRDAQMILTTRAVHFPVMTLRMSMPDAAGSAAGFTCDVDVEFAGRTAKYARVPFQVSMTGVGMRITGTIPVRWRDFKIDSTAAEIPLLLDVTWRPAF